MERKKQTDRKLGEVFVEAKLVSADQLNLALRHQSQFGGRIGSVLLELGYLSTENLLEFLGKFFGVPSADLYKLTIEPAVLGILPFEKMVKYRVIPVAQGVKNVFLAMVEPHDVAAIADLEFFLGKSIQPLVVPAAQMDAVLSFLEQEGEELTEPLRGEEVQRQLSPVPAQVSQGGIRELFRHLVDEHASDLLLSAGVAPCLKKNNEIIRLSGSCLTPAQVEEYVRELLAETRKGSHDAVQDLDFGYTVPELGRFRINIFKQRNTYSIAVRSVVEDIPSLESLGLPDWVADYALKPQGLILITGPTGHGKSTTLAALVDVINSRRKCNIITIEDPIEYLHKHKLSNVNQREVGKDTSSFHEGLRNIFRQAPDVIVIGEMRDPESFAIAIQAAETGHLVLSTLHANSSTSTLERIIEIFSQDKQQQIRVQVAESFLLILNQRLVPRKDGSGRALAYEKLANSSRIRNLIREGKTHQIRTLFHQSAEEYQSIDVILAKLCREGVIRVEEGMKYSDNLAFFRELVARGGKTPLV